MFRLVRTLLLISTVMISSVGIMSPAPSPAVAAATTWYVATTGNDANSCSSPAQPCKTIQAAVDKAINGDTIKVASGTYTGGISSVISINKQVSLSGGWNPLFNSQNERTVIDGQGVIRGIEIGEAGKTRIEKLVVQNGYSVSGGGGIYNVGVLTLTAGIVTSNTAGHPCCFSNNGGGGIANNGSMWIENSAIVYNSVFVNFLGAGILNYRKLFITNSFIAFNKQGEGIYNFNSYSVTTINNSTVYKNESAGLLAHSGTITYGHTILMENGFKIGARDCRAYSGTFVSLGHNLITKSTTFSPSFDKCVTISSDISSFTAGIFTYPNQPNHVLTQHSPAIDAGDSDGCKDYNGVNINSDYYGVSRPIDGNLDSVATCDIGAIEFDPTTNNIRPMFLPSISRNYCPDFFDDFSQNRGWFTIDSNLRRVELLNGEYRSLSKQSGYLFLYRAPTCPRENYSVEVDARWAQTGSDLGLIFGDNGDYGNFYFFDINTDYQAFILLRYSGGAYATLAGPAQTGAINPNTQNNKLKVIRNGTAISLYANNIFLGTWYDGAIAGLTYVGLATSPYDDVPVSDARFDNFSVITEAPINITTNRVVVTDVTTRPLPANINWQPQLNLKVVEQP